MGYFLVQADPVPGNDGVMVSAQIWQRPTPPVEGELGKVVYSEQVSWPRVPFQFRALAHVMRIRISRAAARATQVAVETLLNSEGVQDRDPARDR
jgi:hypothetical protein